MSSIASTFGTLDQRQEQTVAMPTDLWSDDFATKIVQQDFSSAESMRMANHDWRWRNADELYLAWVAQKYWEGTRYPRSSIGVYLAYSQVESFLPHLVGALFGGDAPFDANPEPGTSAGEARAVTNLLTYQLRVNAYQSAGPREVFRKVIKSALIYGNGICEVGWKYFKQKRFRQVASYTPIKQVTWTPMGPVATPTGKFTRNVRQVMVEDEVNMPFANYVSIKDYYQDPNTPSPFVQDGRFAIKRVLSTVDELWALKDTEGFKIPSKEILLELARNHPASNSDNTKSASDTYRNMQWQPSLDSTVDPAGRRIEVLVYHTRDRCVWLGNRSVCLYNAPNKYGFIPYFGAFYTDVLDRFYGLAITDVTEPEQRLQQGIINGRVDELALALHPPMIKKRGMNIPAYQLRRRPGLVAEADDPMKDLVYGQVQNVTQQAFIETEASERRAQKTTGITDLAVLGTSSEGGNSANRTATGVAQQAGASGRRIQYIQENIEDDFIRPVLEAFHAMNQQFLDPNQAVKILGKEGEEIQLDPMDVMNARVRFAMHGASRLSAKQALAQVFPLIQQTLLNPEFLDMLAQQQQKTINVEEIAQMVLDIAGYKPRESLFRQMSPQEVQAMNQPPPQAMIDQQMQRERLAATSGDVESKGMVELLRTAIQGAIDHSLEAEAKKNEDRVKKKEPKVN